MTRSEKLRKEIGSLLRARNTLLWLTSREELRAERMLIDACGDAEYDLRLWDCYTGLTDAEGKVLNATLSDPQQVLRSIRNSNNREVWILRDLHRWIADPILTRGLRSLSRELAEAPRNQARAMIILTPESDIPKDLSGTALRLDFPLPDREEMTEILTEVIDRVKEAKGKDVCPNGAREAVIDAAMGMMGSEAENCFSKCLVEDGDILPKPVAGEKKRIVSQGKGVEWVDPDPRGFDGVGGLDEGKAWAMLRKSAFSKEAREFGLPSPRGLLLAGVPGCGKSHFSKCIATAWNIPLLRFAVEASMSKYVGESEGNFLQVLKLAEAAAPCVLLVDEIEKAMAGSQSSNSDGGVASRGLGILLNWMQEHTAPVFLIATCNDVDKLPAELLRKGRFDEIFFVDLPQLAERAAVLEVTLKQYGRDPELVDSMEIAVETDGFSGAEIAALVPDAMFVAFAQKRQITTEDLVKAARNTTPLSKSAAERINKIREWAQGRARPASSPPKTGKGKGRVVDMN